MSEDCYELDGTVRIEENIRYYRRVPVNIYEITMALQEMSEEEQIKVMKYITRITNKRCTFKALAKKMSDKQLFRAFEKVDAKINNKL